MITVKYLFRCKCNEYTSERVERTAYKQASKDAYHAMMYLQYHHDYVIVEHHARCFTIEHKSAAHATKCALIISAVRHGSQLQITEYKVGK